MSILDRRLPARRVALAVGGVAASALLGVLLLEWAPWSGAGPGESAGAGERPAALGPAPRRDGVVTVDRARQEALGIRAEEVRAGVISRVFDAPGQVVPDEARYAYITPRAPGVVRSVHVQIGQRVEQGQLLARIDSQRVADARLHLIDALQQLEIARARLNWHEATYQNAIDMIDALGSGMPPDEVQRRFAERPVGKTREQLMQAYAQLHLSDYEEDLYQNLRDREAVAPARYRVEKAEYEKDRAVFRGLMDRMAYEVTLDYTLARQRLREARTAVKVELETLRVLNASPDEILRQFESGELTRDAPDDASPESTLRQAAEAAIDPSREIDAIRAGLGEEPVSTYDVRAPFSGTILERGRIVPGVVIDGQERLFTMADLQEVWVEAHVHEGDIPLLRRAENGSIRFTSAAYPGRVFEGRVLYTGDLVEEQSRAIRMIARAENPDRLLKPGMFVEIRVRAEDPGEYPLVPSSAILTEGDGHLVFVQVGPERFERRAVRVGRRDEQRGVVAILDGLRAGDRVVEAGAFALKSELIAEARGGRPAGRADAGGPGEAGR